MLADQAGVIAARGGKAGNSNVKLDLHKHFAEMWLKRAADWRAGVRGGPYSVDADLHPLRNAFKMIDTDDSETIGTSELASVLKAMGTRATAEELDDMVNEIDINGSGAIDFHEFCCFLVFKFFDPDNDGFIIRNDVRDTLRTLGLAPPRERARAADQQAEQLMDFCIEERVASRGSRHRPPGVDGKINHVKRRITLAEFIHVFSDVALIDRPITPPNTGHGGRGTPAQ